MHPKGLHCLESSLEVFPRSQSWGWEVAFRPYLCGWPLLKEMMRLQVEGSGFREILLMIEILHDLLKQNPRSHGSILVLMGSCRMYVLHHQY